MDLEGWIGSRVVVGFEWTRGSEGVRGRVAYAIVAR
jgi:hypothetical protein